MFTAHILFILTSTCGVQNADILNLDAVENELVEKFAKSHDLVEIEKILVKEETADNNHSNLNIGVEAQNKPLVNEEFIPDLIEDASMLDDVINETRIISDFLRENNIMPRALILPILTSEANSSAVTSSKESPEDTTHLFDKGKEQMSSFTNKINEVDNAINNKSRNVPNAKTVIKRDEKTYRKEELQYNENLITNPSKLKSVTDASLYSYTTDNNVTVMELFKMITGNKDVNVPLDVNHFKNETTTSHNIKKYFSSVWKKVKHFMAGAWKKVWKNGANTSNDTNNIDRI